MQNERTKSSALARAKRCRKTLYEIERGFRHEFYELLADCHGIAGDLAANAEEYARFSNDRFWRKCKKKRPQAGDDQSAITLFLCRFIFKAADTEGPRYNRAYKYARVLQGFARDGVDADEVAEKLKAEHGSEFAFVVETEAHPRRNEASATASKTRTGRGAAKTGAAPNGEKADDSSAGPSTKVPEPRVSPDRRPILEVEISDDLLGRVLSVPEGTKARITVRGGECKEGWRRIIATGIKVFPEDATV